MFLKRYRIIRLVRRGCGLAFSLLLAFSVHAQPSQPHSEWVYPGPDGKLRYKLTPNGDRIMDFSHAGYRGGGVAIPELPVRATVQPPVDPNIDCTALIQEAIDGVSRRIPDEHGFRGAVLLMPGEYLCVGELILPASGVVLRGSGTDGTLKSVIRMTGDKHVAIRTLLPQAVREKTQEPEVSSRITDAYVPAGAYTFRVEDASGFRPGDEIELRRPVTEAWIRFMEMHDLVRDGKPQVWMPAGSTINMRRTVATVDGNRITVEVPLSDSFDATYLDPPGTRVVKIYPAPILREVGIEHLRIVSPEQAVNHSQEQYMAIRLNGEDCWVRNVRIEETMNSVGVGGRRITLQRVDVIRKAYHPGASKPAEFAPNGTQILMDRCTVEGDNIWFVALGGRISGPIVLLNCEFKGNGRVEGHQRWTTGFLVDNCRLPEGGLDFKNRGSMGSGHGWGVGWAVAWNTIAKEFVIQQPPGVCNWGIGSTGEYRLLPRPFGEGPLLASGIVDSPGIPVAPHSLYLAQLQDRLGISALSALGYSGIAVPE